MEGEKLREKIDWKSITQEAASLLSEYIKFDTTNPPGNEVEAANFLLRVLKKDGLESEILSSGDGRANLLCRVNGRSSEKPLMLLSHIDVVGAVAKDWSTPPFSGAIRDGYVWGRGAIDCKGLGIMELMAIIMMKRLRRSPPRDIIFLAVADEEAGGEFGAKWVVGNHWNKVSAGFVLNEGGVGISGMFGRDIMMPCFGEKGPVWIRLKAEGEAGHGSMPTTRNANNRLVQALFRISAHETRIILLPEVINFLRGVISSFGLTARLLLPLVVNSPVLNLLRSRLKNIKKVNAVLRNTISITNIKAGFKENVIPSESEAILDCRLLPGARLEDFILELKDVIRDPEIKIEIIQKHSASQSSVDNNFMSTIKSVVQRNTSGALFLPVLAPGFTDSRFFREKGAVAYGFIPCLFKQEEIDTIHGVDERLSLACLESGIRNIFDLCSEF